MSSSELSYKVYNLKMFTLISHNQGEYDESWDDYTQIYSYEINGPLAADIRKKWNLTDDTQVRMLEEVFPAGYSEYTREDDHEFTVNTDSHSIRFNSVAECEKYFKI